MVEKLILPEVIGEPKGKPNPAAVFCEKKGGKFIIEKTPLGETGYCILPDHEKVDAWEFYKGRKKPKKKKKKEEPRLGIPPFEKPIELKL